MSAISCWPCAQRRSASWLWLLVLWLAFVPMVLANMVDLRREKFTRPGATEDEVEADGEAEELMADDAEVDTDTGSQRDGTANGTDVADGLPPDTEDPVGG